ncbi:MAG: TIGR03749 family integrating conjugative element protein [[Actinobacillus] rossii]|uniref:Integrating conjugative element protein, PFL_4704 family n=1 Tax=[Actinobacillus] rossii TaxID=123820 RepID=A0A380U2H8_9PAST|nr:TIGR03749 family integrating conjugative element protein [Actinobacillus porcinus]MCI5764656.1 TIGR03749 family integrating conjugative element protein [Actinobacillus porcinus]MDY3123651.1 TIGR03749 family integrating conjugative element protein [[Actinobacillus] rossii]MDY5420852.1 TIGR03749 family integrating conjugative element protein [Actinobacillus porcinus]SUT95359.1 integrating conjugative element protein, PFL_4704 family [[Actinobacillus] rossii]
MKRLPLCLLSFLAFSMSEQAFADILMKWDRKPIPVALQVNTERIIFMDKNVKVGYPAELEGKLRIQSTGGAVYLKALGIFQATRLEFRDVATGEIFLFDIGAHKKVSNPTEAIRVVADSIVEKQSGSLNQDDLAETEVVTRTPQLPIPAALTRYAAQSLYAPLRTVEPLEEVRRVAHRLPEKITTLLPAYPITANPLMSWQLDNYVVTAVRLQNRGVSRITLDPRELQGRFYAATFQHNWLGGYGSSEDTTTVYLVTEGHANNAVIPETKIYKAPKKVKKTTVTTRKNVIPQSTK